MTLFSKAPCEDKLIHCLFLEELASDTKRLTVRLGTESDNCVLSFLLTWLSELTCFFFLSNEKK